ncbi:UDP-glucosyl transferase 73B2 [Apostasia shenzhenica]|uniref:Glycosyltransferase n=1 Tax=Apostasia shenzhenica TaxID=1088818 RepID=A0A2I0A9D7_9ASPA|nr:UDP-glucosyl transferase 73B2 [Apostasia shenzhenica]
MIAGEIIVVPFPHPGHVFPSAELCRRLAEQKCKVTILLPPTSSSLSSLHHPLIQIVQLPLADSIRIDPSFLDATLPTILSDLLALRRDSSSLPKCAIVDEMIGWLASTFISFRVPAFSFFTSSAVSSALEHAASKLPQITTPPAAVGIPGLPEEMALTAFDLVHYQNGNGPAPFGPKQGQDGRPRRRRDIESTDGVVGLIMNTCADLERPFLDYVAREAGKPVWAVGPLLPDVFWSAVSSPVRDDEVRARRDSEVTEAEVLEWLESKPRGSVIYVSFGSLVLPGDSELEELAAGLEDSGRPFIWVIQPGARQHDPYGKPIASDGHAAAATSDAGGYLPKGLEKRLHVEGRGMVIRGWAPQLLILSHPSTGGYVCHCGWNSALEALCCGVPVLAWPVRGDQVHNAKLLTNQLRVGLSVRPEQGKAVSRADVVQGIQKLMSDEDMRKRASSVRGIFTGGLPQSSVSALNGFLKFECPESANK